MDNMSFSVCFNTNHIPKLWLRASIVAILKPEKNVNSPTSHRPISLLCIPYKLLERVILTRITPIIESILPPEQPGFRRGRSTLNQEAQITDDIEESFDMGPVTGAVSLDLIAAYDTVWLTGLQLKIQKAISFNYDVLSFAGQSSLMFDRFACFWPKGSSGDSSLGFRAGSLSARSTQND